VTFHDRQLTRDTVWDGQASPSRPISDNGSLGRTEWSVIDMARAEGPRSANPNAFVNRLLARLFGIATPRPFANERLERLRRFALSAWFRAEIRTRDLRALFKAGFSSNDAARIIAYVGLHRGSEPEVEGWP
jgi:hypothetical protein